MRTPITTFVQTLRTQRRSAIPMLALATAGVLPAAAQVPPLIGGGTNYACTLSAPNGTVQCRGRNREGQLGNGGTTHSASAVTVQGLGGRAIAIAAGFYPTCAVLESGSVRCWDSNEYGELGNGTTTAFGVTNPTPVSVSGITDAIAITAGRYFTCALSANGTVQCWGDTAIVASMFGSARTSPATVPGLTNVVAFAGGWVHACALRGDGAVLCWGRMFSTSRTTPLAVAGHTIDTRLDMAEYRHVSLDCFFMTSRHGEKILLSNLGTIFAPTTHPSFKVHSNPLAAATLKPITRYDFDPIARGNSRGSHFYTLLDAENAALRALNPGNANVPRLPQDEGVDSFAFLPVTEGVGGSCATGQRPVYRAFRGQARFPDDPNHRFTTDLALYTSLVNAGWDGEGVRPGPYSAPALCCARNPGAGSHTGEPGYFALPRVRLRTRQGPAADRHIG